jgi:hypothetical protein
VLFEGDGAVSGLADARDIGSSGDAGIGSRAIRIGPRAEPSFRIETKGSQVQYVLRDEDTSAYPAPGASGPLPNVPAHIYRSESQ